MKKIHLFSTFLVLIVVLKSFSQTTTLKKANSDYKEYAYIDAIAIYEQVAEKGYHDEEMFQRLGNAYYFNADLISAAKWYDALFLLNPDQNAEYHYRYAQAFKGRGDSEMANVILARLATKWKDDSRGQLFEKQKNYLELIMKNSGRYEVQNAGINSAESDYGSAIYNHKLVFASARDTGGLFKRNFKWTNRAFTNLYLADLNADGSLSLPKRVNKKVNSKFNESTPVYTKDGQTMYFTRNNYLAGKRGKDDQKITLLKLYKASFIKGKWTKIIELPFNSDQYSTAHPALSADEKYLYFASDRPGTKGQSDLFKAQIKDDGSFGVPENLGDVNTEGRETFPFISSSNELYFASDGHLGLGGLDVFVTNLNDEGQSLEVKNLGEPINSIADDFAFIVDEKNKNGFFTSNREGGIGSDDIYKFVNTKKAFCNKVVKGNVFDIQTKERLAVAKIIVLDEDYKHVQELFADENGDFSFESECGKNYYLRAEKAEYETNEIKVTISADSKDKEILCEIGLEKRIKPITLGTDLAKTLDISIIYFDLDKSIIRPDAAFQLAKIVATMQQFPKMKIDVRSHTDSRQTATYNRSLSERRAQSTIKWLIKQGIAPNRLTGKGYGESQLTNHCSDGAICTEAEHQLNRRSEFIVISMD